MFRSGISALVVLSIFCVCPNNFAQTGPAAATDAVTLKTGVQLVVLDVVVTDSRGATVPGLTREDFHVSENKTEQPLKSFEEHSGSVSEGVKLLRPIPGIFTNVNVTAGNGSVNVVLIDALNTPPQSQPYLRDQLVRYLAQQQPGARVAVFAMTTQLRMLQDFTSDPALLRQAIKAQGVKFSPLLNRELNDTAAHQESEQMSDLIASASTPDMAAMLRGIQSTLLDMEAQRASVQTQIRARQTMDILRQIGRYLAGIPGRKNLLWFSGSFPVVIQRDIMTTGRPFEGYADMQPEFRKTIDLLARSQVAMYPIDSRGLEAPPSMSPSESGATGNVQRTRDTYGSTSYNPRDNQFYLDQASEHGTMNDLAEGTGGRAFYNMNGLAEATAQAIHDGSEYYTVSYSLPQPDKAGYRDITVKLTDTKGRHLAYRRGYNVDAIGKLPADTGKQVADVAISDSVLSRSTPVSTELVMRMQPEVVLSADPTKTVGAKLYGNTLQSTTYQLNIAVTPDKLTFTPAGDGKTHAAVEFATVIYDEKGKMVDSHQDRANLALDDTRLHVIQGSSLRFHTFVVLPATGDVAVRLVVHDVPSGRVGSLLVSADAIRKAALPAQQ